MGLAFSKLIPKKNKELSTLEPLVPEFTIEDMEFEATVISKGIEPNPDIANIDQPVAPEPVLIPNQKPIEASSAATEEPVAVSVAAEEPVASEELVASEEPVVASVVAEEPVDKREKKDKKEKRKKLRKESL